MTYQPHGDALVAAIDAACAGYWAMADELSPGDRLGYIDAEGSFAPGVEVVAVAPVTGTVLWNVTTHAGSLVLHGGTDVYAFPGAPR